MARRESETAERQFLFRSFGRGGAGDGGDEPDGLSGQSPLPDRESGGERKRVLREGRARVRAGGDRHDAYPLLPEWGCAGRRRV